jgi:23S rRNA (adenine2030-N6)-methyltransferase
VLSYRHASHAGNHADVLKHLVLVQLRDYRTLKDKPVCYIDTHAGAGRYSLACGHRRTASPAVSGSFHARSCGD